MAIEVPVSSDVMMPTFAPSLMHCSAWASCFCCCPRAFTTDAVSLAFLKALMNAVLSNCSQRTDDAVSGSRTHTCVPVAADFALFPDAPPTTRPTATAATRNTMLSFFTPCPPSSSEPPAGTLLRPSRLFKLPGPTALPSSDRHLLPGPFALRRGATASKAPARGRHRPRRVEHTVERQGRGAAHGGAVAEGRRQNEKRPRAGGQRAL